MERAMRVYGLNLIEMFLTDVLGVLGWLLILLAIAAAIFRGAFVASELVGGMLIAGSAIDGVVLMLGSAGVRQNRAAVDLGYCLSALIGLGWLLNGLLSLRLGSLAAGLVILLLFVLMSGLRRLAIQARFKPRFLSLRQFETMIQIADTMIDGDGAEVLHPIEVAIRVDHLLAKIDSPLLEDIKRTLDVVEWLLPLRIGRPLPFSDLGSHERRRAVEKVIGSKGIFRDVARFLKMLACVGYYGSVEAMSQVGYVPFEERQRSTGVDQAPKEYPDPFVIGVQR